MLNYFFLHANDTPKNFLGTNWKKYDSRKDLLDISNCSASQDVTLAIKNKFTPNIYNLCCLGAPKAFRRFSRKHSWWSHFSIQSLLWTVNLTKRRTLPPVFSEEIFENKWLWVAASERSKIAACNVIQFLTIKISFGIA